MMKASKGFTLVELIVVIAIIAILASVSIVGYNQFIQNARDSRAETELSVIQRQVEANFYVDPLVVTINEDLRATVSFDPADEEFSFVDDEIQEWVLVADGTQYYNGTTVQVSAAQVWAVDATVLEYPADAAARLALVDTIGQVVFQIDDLQLYEQTGGNVGGGEPVVWTAGDVLPNTEPQPSFEVKAAPDDTDREALIEQAILDSLDEDGLSEGTTLEVAIVGTVITVTYTVSQGEATWVLNLG